MTRKKVLPIVFVTLIIFSTMVCTFAQAFAGSVYGDFRYTVNADKTITIDAYVGDATEPYIPRKIQGKNVQTIGEYAFSGNLNIKKINIPEGVTTVAQGAFFNCTELKEVFIPETVKKIDNAAFFGCTRIDKLSLSDNIEYLGEGAFYYCESLKNIDFPDNLTSMGDFVFGYCRGLETVAINSKLTEDRKSVV